MAMIGRRSHLLLAFLLGVLCISSGIAKRLGSVPESKYSLTVNSLLRDLALRDDEEPHRPGLRLSDDPKIVAAYRSLAQQSTAREEQHFHTGMNAVCEAIHDNAYQPIIGINSNGTTVELRRFADGPQTFYAGYCITEAASCNGIKRNGIIRSTCETRLRWQLAVARPFGSDEPWSFDQILVPHSCQCIYFVASEQPKDDTLDWTFDNK